MRTARTTAPITPPTIAPTGVDESPLVAVAGKHLSTRLSCDIMACSTMDDWPFESVTKTGKLEASSGRFPAENGAVGTHGETVVPQAQCSAG